MGEGGEGRELQRRPHLVRWLVVGLEVKEEALGLESYLF